jgi:hypothetical protein
VSLVVLFAQGYHVGETHKQRIVVVPEALRVPVDYLSQMREVGLDLEEMRRGELVSTGLRGGKGVAIGPDQIAVLVCCPVGEEIGVVTGSDNRPRLLISVDGRISKAEVCSSMTA